ncbi:hypothetical protein MHM88_14390 [Epibacterium sp. MM17-32]|uniref:hypothetical protein n=1 Tax=Epibacterium sp. MM17-32 TaxID=2917734 RepID=UPI001EF5F07D|nr:hypothetical protein [Epibacterium sp. MM17-32]MCG7628997.1 hypothetical protein [Epibacterium sp. MM17-32]
MWRTAGEDVNFLIDYVVDGEFVIPSSAEATVRDNAGVPIAELTAVSLVVDTTSATLTIPAAQNTVAAGNTFETRFVVTSFVYEGETYTRVHSYRLHPFVPLTTTPGDVRRELGLDSSELPDRDIDILSAYLTLRADYGTQIEDALTSGDQRSLAINKAVAVKAALALVDGLPFRAAIKMKAEDSSVERMSEFDVSEIRIRLGQQLGRALDVIRGITTGGAATIVLSNPTDAITGA